MTILMLTFALLFLIINIYSYKNIFKSSNKLNEQLQKQFEEKSESEKAFAKLFLLATMSVIIFVFLLYYIIAGSLMINISFMVILTAIFGVKCMLDIVGVLKMLDGKYKYRLYARLLVPVNTFYHCYFIYFILIK